MKELNAADLSQKAIDFLLVFFPGFASWLIDNFFIIKFISAIISILLGIGIIYLAAKAKYIAFKVDLLMDTVGAGDLLKRRSLRAWKDIIKKLRSKDPEKWKQALMDADNILYEILKSAGYKGEDLTGRLENITSAQISNIEELRQAHVLALKAKNEPEFSLEQSLTGEALFIFQKAFQELRLLE